jgi:hypothetical protein
MNTINKDEILKSSKWIRFIFMVIYAFAINFALTISIGLAFVQFLFVLFTSKVNTSIANVNSYIIEFFDDSLAFLLFQTEEKPFRLKIIQTKKRLLSKLMKLKNHHQNNLKINQL